MISADELLRSEPISSLRSLVNQLEKECNNKQDELRQLVGSKYHDFIESNEAIVSMATKSWSSLQIVQEIPQLSQNAIDKTTAMLQAVQYSDQDKINDRQTFSTGSLKLSDDVWLYLDCCDVYSASILLFLSTQVLNSYKTVKVNIDLNHINETLFLKQTVINDCKLLLLCDIEPIERCKSLASLALLNKFKQANLLSLYLNVLDVSIQSTIESLNENTSSIEQKLLSLVNLIQQFLIDVYTYFFEKSDNTVSSVYEKLLKDIQSYSTIIHSNLSSSNSNFIDYSLNEFICDFNELKESFDIWFNEKVLRILSDRLLKLLTSAVDSAVHMSELQGILYQAVDFCNISPFYDNDRWSLASQCLLNQRLWDVIFRSPFMIQVERHLRGAALKTLERTKNEIIISIENEGLIVNAQALRTQENDDEWIFNSLQIHSIADRIRIILTDELNDIARAVLKPGLFNEDLKVLSRGLQIQLSHFIGSLSCFFREITTSLKPLLSLSPAANRAVAIIGRLAWLLRSKGKCLQNLFQLLQRNLSDYSFSNVNGLIDEDQLASAFQIADVNADGIVTSEEAIEVFQALSIDTSSENFIGLLTSSTLSYDEFLLLSCHILSDKEYCLDCSNRTLSSTIRFTHLLLLEQTTHRLQFNLNSNLSNEYGLSNTLNHSLPTYLSSWQSINIDIDGNNELVLIPSVPTSSIQTFIFGVTLELTDILSVDTLQSLSEKQSHDQVTDLAAFVREIALYQSIVIIEQSYQAIMKLSDNNNRKEDFALQVYYDILCVKNVLHIKEQKNDNEIVIKLNRLIDELLAKIDPVCATFVVPILSTMSQQFHHSFSLLTLHAESTFTNAIPQLNVDELLENVLGKQSSSRFGLLALPLTTSQIGNINVHSTMNTATESKLRQINKVASTNSINSSTLSYNTASTKGLMSGFNITNIAGSFLGNQS